MTLGKTLRCVGLHCNFVSLIPCLNEWCNGAESTPVMETSSCSCRVNLCHIFRGYIISKSLSRRLGILEIDSYFHNQFLR